MAYPGRGNPLKGSRSLHKRNSHGLRDGLILCVVVAAFVVIARFYLGGPARKPPEPSVEPREVLEQKGIPQSDFDKFTRGFDLGDGEKEILWRIMQTIGTIDTTQVNNWCKATTTVSWTDFRQSLQENRCRFFHVQGDVARVVAEDVPGQLTGNRLFRCEFVWTVAGEQQQAVVYAPPPSVPTHWSEGTGVRNERIRFCGLFLKCSGGGRDNPHTPLFVAREVILVPQLATP